MSTSADHGRDGVTGDGTGFDPARFSIGPARLTDPGPRALIAEVQAEYVVRYGSPDGAPLDAAEFEPPAGLFLLGRLDGIPVACGGWRRHGLGADGVRIAEIKRMFVSARARRRGLARRVLAELERTAVAAGIGRMVLETGLVQPEAIALYAERGYRPTEAFGFYKDAPLAVHLAHDLARVDLGPTPAETDSRARRE